MNRRAFLATSAAIAAAVKSGLHITMPVEQSARPRRYLVGMKSDGRTVTRPFSEGLGRGEIMVGIVDVNTTFKVLK